MHVWCINIVQLVVHIIMARVVRIYADPVTIALDITAAVQLVNVYACQDGRVITVQLVSLFTSFFFSPFFLHTVFFLFPPTKSLYLSRWYIESANLDSFFDKRNKINNNNSTESMKGEKKSVALATSSDLKKKLLYIWRKMYITGVILVSWLYFFGDRLYCKTERKKTRTVGSCNAQLGPRAWPQQLLQSNSCARLCTSLLSFASSLLFFHKIYIYMLTICPSLSYCFFSYIGDV